MTINRIDARVVQTSRGRKIEDMLLDVSYNVLDFGAKGDGVTNDAAVIQSVIDAAAVSGGEVYFPAGTYLIGSPLYLKSNVSIVGAGAKTSVIKSNMTGTAIFIQGIPATPNEWISVENIMIQSVNTTNSPVIHMESAYYVSFTDVNVIGDSSAISSGSVGIYIVGTNTGYYGTFIRTQFAYFDTGAKLENSSNAHRFMTSWFYGCNIGINIINSNGVLIHGNTFQDFYRKAIRLSDSLNKTYANMISGNYIEYKIGSSIIECGVEINSGVRTTMLYGNNYTNLRPTYPEVTNNGVYTTRIEWSGADYRETLRLPNFTNFPLFDEASKPAVNAAYRGSLSFTTSPGAKDMLRGVVLDGSGNPQWVQIPYSMNGALDLTGITAQNGVIQQYSDGYVLVGTNANATERSLNYDTGFKMLRYRDDTGWRYLQGNRSGATAARPTIRFVGMEYFDTTLVKPIWWDGTNWKDATGATV